MAVDKATQAQTMKTLIEAYGIGVRSGVLTPCLQDENSFRQLMGLGPAPQEVERSWLNTNGVRSPVTLQDGIPVPDMGTSEVEEPDPEAVTDDNESEE